MVDIIALFIPMVFAVCIVLAIRAVVESRLRRRLAETHASEDLIRTLLLTDQENRHQATLKWGMVLVLTGLAFGLIDIANLTAEDAASYGILFGAIGLGMIGYHFLPRARD
ncbi:DUF6249 domain-containing protein [Marilutibacter aestuarii]|uniref:DUF6249 domain-containing protein n=1 Tax=Marilutibacter aestuarii TaxID=1706195 RepID=A0A508AIJ0_9GAMM|nr:DUF6249 domain-containing protein [Lysobacter aestuarii]TQD49716.1 hypothetical protein FKV25_04125 [Lysobacter aestuarii]